MDVLKNTKFMKADYVCRYAGTPFSYNEADDKYVFHIGTNLSHETSYVNHKVKESDTLESLALHYYNNPTYYWAIANFNDIQDCFIKLSEHYKVIKVPQIVGIKFKGDR